MGFERQDFSPFYAVVYAQPPYIYRHTPMLICLKQTKSGAADILDAYIEHKNALNCDRDDKKMKQKKIGLLEILFPFFDKNIVEKKDGHFDAHDDKCCDGATS
eukprot:GHVU01046375.1.p1 GENE.GHVU01046375.1~~GHVU01046375.1.p1  ORF type:complete len:103 (-),score=11.61 GHVU01046375.1:115-423(-)